MQEGFRSLGLVRLITRRSQVQILSPQPIKSKACRDAGLLICAPDPFCAHFLARRPLLSENPTPRRPAASSKLNLDLPADVWPTTYNRLHSTDLSGSARHAHDRAAESAPRLLRRVAHCGRQDTRVDALIYSSLPWCRSCRCVCCASAAGCRRSPRSCPLQSLLLR